MNTITANELKMKGVTAVEACLEEEEEAIISVRGKSKYVIMDLIKYEKLREYELEIALLEAKADVANGRYVSESVDDHMKRITDGL